MRAHLILSAILAAGLSACAKVDKDNPFPAGSAMHQHYAEVSAKIKAHPKLEAELKQAKSGFQAVTIGDHLVKKGMAKLDDASLLRFAKLLPDLLDGMSMKSCGALAKGRAKSTGAGGLVSRLFGSGKSPEQEFLEALGKGDPDKGRSYLDLVYLALTKAVDDPFTPPPPHPAEINAALQNLLGSRFTPEQREGIISTLAAGRRAKDEDTCWAIKALYANIAVTPPHHRRVILRYMISDET